jgi:hypothetical protein
VNSALIFVISSQVKKSINDLWSIQNSIRSSSRTERLLDFFKDYQRIQSHEDDLCSLFGFSRNL